jgi:hypothetical protein
MYKTSDAGIVIIGPFKFHAMWNSSGDGSRRNQTYVVAHVCLKSQEKDDVQM